MMHLSAEKGHVLLPVGTVNLDNIFISDMGGSAIEVPASRGVCWPLMLSVSCCSEFISSSLPTGSRSDMGHIFW